MNLYSIKIGLAILVFTTLLISCVPEDRDPKPYSYIIDGPQDLHPAFSPDGAQIAYYHFSSQWPEPLDYPTGLYIIDADGANRRIVLKGKHYCPSWSPDGQWLVFSSDGLIEKCKLNGDSLTSFEGLQLEDWSTHFPDWSPDGSSIFFENTIGYEMGTYVMSGDFQNPVKISEGGDIEISPDGLHLTLTHSVDDSDFSEIFVSDYSGTTMIRLTRSLDREDRYPTWSPDGDKILWSSDRRLSIIGSDGNGHKEIGYGNGASWSVNNEIVYSHANSDYTTEVLYLITPEGKDRRQITF